MKTGASKLRYAPVFNPGRTYLMAGILLCCTFGITVAAAEEAHLSGYGGWAWFFAVCAVVCFGLYLWIVRAWIMVTFDHSGDYTDVDADVVCWDDWDYYDPGER